MSQLTAFKSTSSLSNAILEVARNTLPYTAVEGFTSPEWRCLLQNLDNLVSLVVPLQFALIPRQVFILSSSDSTMVCPRSKCLSVRRIAGFVEARHDAGITPSSPGVDVSVATPVSEGVSRLHQELRSIGRGGCVPVRFRGKVVVLFRQ